jgi:peptidoglycan/LPS O-acetylase OafA/YrhL
VEKGTAINHYAYIDSLRGWALFGVIVVHVCHSFPALEQPLRNLANEGMRGVQLFFVVSALTLMLSWHHRADGVVPFYIRRIFRIAPMFWLAIVVVLVFDGFASHYWAPAGISWWHVAAASVFMHGWSPQSINSVVPGGWSVAVEMTFYALFPLLAFLCQSFFRTVAMLFISLVVGMILNNAMPYFFSPDPPQQPAYLITAFRYFWFWSQLPIFLIGIATYFAIRDARPKNVFWPNLAVYVSLLCVALVALGDYVPLSAALRQALPNHLKFGLCFGLLAYGLGCGASSIVVNRFAGFVGKVSFSGYLWHFAVLSFFSKLAAQGIDPFQLNDKTLGWPYFLQLLVVVTIATTALSYVTYQFVEQPMIRIGSNVAKNVRRPAPVPVISCRQSSDR